MPVDAAIVRVPDPHDATSTVLRAGPTGTGRSAVGAGMVMGRVGPDRGLGTRVGTAVGFGWLWVGVVALLLVLVVGLVVVKAREPGRQSVHRRLGLWVQVDEIRGVAAPASPG